MGCHLDPFEIGNLANPLDTKIDDANGRNKHTYPPENEETYPTEKTRGFHHFPTLIGYGLVPWRV